MKKLTTLILGAVMTIGLTGLGFAQTTPDTSKKTETKKEKKHKKDKKAPKTQSPTTAPAK